jgi:hypothetical protein
MVCPQFFGIEGSWQQTCKQMCCGACSEVWATVQGFGGRCCCMRYVGHLMYVAQLVAKQGECCTDKQVYDVAVCCWCCLMTAVACRGLAAWLQGSYVATVSCCTDMHMVLTCLLLLLLHAEGLLPGCRAHMLPLSAAAQTCT